MVSHTAYTAATIPSADDLQWYQEDIASPSEDAFELYRKTTDAVLTQLDEAFEIGSFDKLTFVYGDWTGERAEELAASERGKTSLSSAYSFHPSFQEWADQPTIYIKSSTGVDGWEDSFKNAIVHKVNISIWF